jgi:hypothetical protein
MKTLLLMLVVMMLAGCAVPHHAFSPFTTSDGKESFRLVASGYDETAIQPLLESSIGKARICPHGWFITNRQKTWESEVIEGQCKP